MNPVNEPYDYNSAGFDNFLSRSIDNLNQTNLDSQGPISTQFRFDSAQISGALGDRFTIGNILFDGSEKRITMTDGSGVTRLIMGNDPNGF